MNPANQICRGQPRNQRQIFDSSAIALNDHSLRNQSAVRRCILRTFAVNIRLQKRKRVLWRRLIKENDIIHRLDRLKHGCAFVLRQDGAERSFVKLNRSISIEADHQKIAQLPRHREARHVTGMQKIEAAVGPDDRLPGLARGVANCQKSGPFHSFCSRFPSTHENEVPCGEWPTQVEPVLSPHVPVERVSMRTVRIGNGCGFWGDSPDAPLRLVQTGQLDYLTLEYLAELTMSILALQKQKDPKLGYATDFVKVLTELAPELERQPDLKIVTNAGGMNPIECARRIQEIVPGMRIAVVSGDDLLPRLDELLATGHTLNHLDTGEPLSMIRDRVVSANAYLGSAPIASALADGARIVITGRVADACLVVGPLIHEFGWQSDELLSAATVAGHLIECGAQATGGLWIHADRSTNLENIGYPIAVVSESGEFLITKPEGTGGVVNCETISEQLLYEVGDPARYITPDVVADFTSLQLNQAGKDTVRVTDCRGKPATDSYKVSVAYRDGYTAAGTLVLAGPHAREHAQHSGEIILARLKQCGCEFEHSLIEVIGEGEEVMLRLAVRDARRANVERFTRELAPLVTSGYAGTTGYTTGRAAVREVFAYWPTLISKSALEAKVEHLV